MEFEIGHGQFEVHIKVAVVFLIEVSRSEITSATSWILPSLPRLPVVQNSSKPDELVAKKQMNILIILMLTSEG